MPRPKNPLIGVKSLPARFESFSKAGGTEHFIIMFSDALPAEKAAALRTTGHCLAKHMIYTALVSEVRHSQLAKSFIQSLITKGSVCRNLTIQ